MEEKEEERTKRVTGYREILEEGGRVSAYLKSLPGWDASTWVEAVKRTTA